ncbi:methylated-DNA--[protein]-cysteine S-methyltransferase [Weissella diestrammenae]|uniref:methylated-DNA--[protein]-cysteine S-methyltransferase n=1 Tax=Weissella diestrammenae TaxID=1162633 RepID=A0A7G9T4S4_9LACO|nr:methylated-DNA--[protein]-cysteine S-methyltransferase [Weissella diestrammenae]MCM0582810.1 methylated-DNA--[protein]-cysteine S-methyltransferase [Weissella diestrammenae]QNN75099.1 methylated-DNA--[protein]-cysteine S-methyltransferase [Weissella diestrammenae]
MVYYETQPFFQGQITLFQSDSKLVFVSLAENAVEEFHLFYPALDLQPGSVDAMINFLGYAQNREVDFSYVAFDFLQGTPFQRTVWQFLMSVKVGTTITYQDVAFAIKKPNAIRAVATAVGKNPLTIMIPCHRIVPKAGGTGRYRYGEKWKNELLRHEN